MILLLAACQHHDAPLDLVDGVGAVAADHVLASQAGVDVLRAGGNAVDAAITAALVSGVVQPSGSGLGGGGFAVVVFPDGEAHVLDFRETAPAASTPDMFVPPPGATQGPSSTRGPRSVATPGEALGLVELHRRWGRAPWASVVAPATAYARDGFEPGPHLAEALLAAPDMASLFDAGHKRPRLATALQALADTYGAAFRDGWVAQDFVDAAGSGDGVLRLSDLANYQVKERTPLVGRYGEDTVVTMPPPSSGGVALLQLLGTTQGATEHCRVEAVKHAMAERSGFGADPDFVPVDTAALLAPEHLAAIKADCAAATYLPDHYARFTQPDDHGTLHISVMDGSGMAVALTTTINTAFGSHVVAPKSGIVLNDEMDDFATRPGIPNAYGLVQGTQNVPEPGKRPLSSMTPTVVLDADHHPFLVAGGSGGPTIITGTWQVIANVVERHMPALEAVSAPRWHHQWQPDVLMAEPGVDTADLEARGHAVKRVESPFTSVQIVVRDGRTLSAASDPRKHGEAVVGE